MIKTKNKEALEALDEIGTLLNSELRSDYMYYDEIKTIRKALERPQVDADKLIHHNGKDYYPNENGWYDIECAPKDGTRILIKCDCLPEKQKVNIGSWCIDCPAKRFIFDDGFTIYPLGWQPLPQVPKECDK